MSTDLAVFRFMGGKLTFTELMARTTLEEIRSKTSTKFNEDLA
ncbi:hypothetical protein [Chryseobacterium koreense]|nr:hypothetical protein [Chryseobacterium koreense]MBB5332913.1 acyl CoA:acetate/3-ketoacid CoA transferase beta subunit [Chryseobacterium koreense]